MSSQDFCYWLQGWLEIQNPKTINEIQTQEIKNHLALVFIKLTPVVTAPNQWPTLPSQFPQTYCNSQANSSFNENKSSLIC